jgi:hypothetical protein
MTFAAQLQTAKGDLTARQVAAAVSPLLSVRTVEEWLADRRSPPAWTQDWILSRVHPPKKPRRAKGQNVQDDPHPPENDHE